MLCFLLLASYWAQSFFKKIGKLTFRKVKNKPFDSAKTSQKGQKTRKLKIFLKKLYFFYKHP